MWWFGWRNYLSLSANGMTFTDPFARTRHPEWSEIDRVEIQRDPTGRRYLLVSLDDGGQYPVFATQLDLIEGLSPKKNEWLEGILQEALRLQAAKRPE
jgi:hypothetical protein